VNRAAALLAADPAAPDERLGQRVAQRAREVRRRLGGVKALEREAPAARPDRGDVDAERGRRAAGTAQERSARDS
jgi:hypothetical protein